MRTVTFHFWTGILTKKSVIFPPRNIDHLLRSLIKKKNPAFLLEMHL